MYTRLHVILSFCHYAIQSITIDQLCRFQERESTHVFVLCIDIKVEPNQILLVREQMSTRYPVDHIMYENYSHSIAVLNCQSRTYDAHHWPGTQPKLLDSHGNSTRQFQILCFDRLGQ